MRQGQQRHDGPVVTASSARRWMRGADARAAVRCSICQIIELNRRIELKLRIELNRMYERTYIYIYIYIHTLHIIYIFMYIQEYV